MPTRSATIRFSLLRLFVGTLLASVPFAMFAGHREVPTALSPVIAIGIMGVVLLVRRSDLGDVLRILGSIFRCGIVIGLAIFVFFGPPVLTAVFEHFFPFAIAFATLVGILGSVVGLCRNHLRTRRNCQRSISFADEI